MSEPILVLTTGGTIVKQYLDALSQYQITDVTVTKLLAVARVTTTGVLAGAPWLTPQDQRQEEANSLTYTSPPLETDLEVTRNPMADLYVSSSADFAYFVVRVCGVAPDGISKLVTDGALNAT